ncbi:ArsR/SmtB family transcription factor [Chitinivibrio alkaliphilus]|nr:metalloregulator ArsR/SmtB family transcription factor [Chitinivibrio alkaliphilus]
MDTCATLFKALSDKNRLRILGALLTEEPLCAYHIRAMLNVSGATVSNHMALLMETGLVQGEKKGRWMLYHIPEPMKAHPVLIWVASTLEKEPQIGQDRAMVKKVACS